MINFADLNRLVFWNAEISNSCWVCVYSITSVRTVFLIVGTVLIIINGSGVWHALSCFNGRCRLDGWTSLPTTG